MRLINISAGVFVLAVVVATGCSGKLEVGDESANASSADGDSSGGMGGTTSGSTNGGSTISGASSSGGSSSEGSSGGSSSEGASGGSTGGTGGDSVPDDVAPAPGSSEECPDGFLISGNECATDGIRCRYQYESTENQECYCRRTWGDQQVWECETWNNRDLCPLEPPEDLSECYGSFGLFCWYPANMECSCSSDTGAWQCPRDVFEVADPPELPADDRLVAELTDEERETWCEWYSLIRHKPGHVPPEDRPVTGEYTDGVGCSYTRGFCEAGVPKLSKSECIANLRLSDCEASMANLTGCVIDVFSNECGPFEYSCLDYLETPDCEGTIVLDVDVAELSCDVRVQ